jgi:hypothetical protein
MEVRMPMMLKFTLSEGGGPAREEDVRGAEEGLGASFPADFRAFILQYNGGFPEPTMKFLITRDRGKSILTQLYAVGESVEPAWHRLLDETAILQVDLPRGVAVIGRDPFGNKICLGLSGRLRGRVFFWDHEVLPRAFDRMRGLVEIAASFSAFMDSLEPEPPEIEHPIRALARRGSPADLESYLAKGGSLSDCDKYGLPLVIACAVEGNLALIRECHRLGASMKNLIHCAARNRNREVVEYLLSVGVDVNERLDNPRDVSDLGKTALDWSGRGSEMEAWLASIGGKSSKEL